MVKKNINLNIFYYYCLLIYNIVIDFEDILYQSLLIGNLSRAADLFLDNEKPVEALLLATAAGPETLSRIQNKYLKVRSNIL